MEALIPGLLAAGFIWYGVSLYNAREADRKHDRFRAKFTDEEWKQFVRSPAGKEYYK